MDKQTRQHNWYIQNRERLAIISKARYEAKKGAILASRRDRRAARSPAEREAYTAYLKQWNRDNFAKVQKKKQSDEYKFSDYRQSATKRDYQFDLSYETFKELFHGDCAYCGQVEARGIDRVDNALGYTIENAVSCCEMCNKMKWRFSQASFIEHIKRIAAFNT